MDNWINVYLEDASRNINMIDSWHFQEAGIHYRCLRQRQLKVGAKSENAHLEVPELALKLCVAKSLLRTVDANALDSPSSEGGARTPLIEKCYDGDLQAVELLMKAGASINVVDLKTEASPLHAACTGGDKDVVVSLLKAE